jgi:hypothetical protein
MNFTILGFMGEAGSGKDFCSDWVINNKKFTKVAFADPIKRFCQEIFGFSDAQLWGDTKYRGERIIPWKGAVKQEASKEKFIEEWSYCLMRMNLQADAFVNRLYLSIVEKSAYKNVLFEWFDDLRTRADSGTISARVALQLLGTEYGRYFKHSIWVDYLYKIVVPGIREHGFAYDQTRGLVQKVDPVVRESVNGVIVPDHRFLNELELSQEYGGYVIKLVRLSQKDKANKAEEDGIKGHASEAEQRSIPDDKYDLVLELNDGAENVYPRLEKMFEVREWEIKSKEARSTKREPG